MIPFGNVTPPADSTKPCRHGVTMNTPVVSGQVQLAVLSHREVDVKAAKDQIQAIQQIMKAVMIEGTHYGVIPGCKQPSLYKAGSEALLSAFHVSVEPEVSVAHDGDHTVYTVKCVGRHMQTGTLIGVGIGECSTAEEKYAWRAAVCDEEFEATPETRKRVKWNKGYQGSPAYSVNQVRTNPADLANTCLKMAKKRAQIDLCLTALGCSDLFTQDLEDLPEGYLDGNEPTAPAPKNKYQPKPRDPNQQGGGDGSPATEGQIKMIKARMAAAQKADADLLAFVGVESIEAIPKAKVNGVLDWIAGKA